jgi:hypothetical protein
MLLVHGAIEIDQVDGTWYGRLLGDNLMCHDDSTLR